MALLEEWILPVEVDKKLQRSIESLAGEILPEGIEWIAVTSKANVVTFTAHVPVDDLEALALDLDEPLEHFHGWAWQEEIDAIEGDAYELKVECRLKTPETFASDAELPILSVYSKEGHNLAAWPAAFVLTARLAHELGATEPTPAPEATA